MVINKAVRIYFGIGLALATFTGEALASCSSSGVNQVTCTGGQGASISTGGGFGVETHGSPYPATLVVSGVSGTISGLQVRLNSYSADVTRDLGVMMRSPSGKNLQLLREPRRGDAGSAVTFTITFADGGTVVPCTAGNFNTTGTYSPTNCTPEAGTGNTPGTPPGGGNYGVAGTVNLAAPLGAATLTATNGVYTGDTPNGTWGLYLAYDGPTPNFPISWASWDLIINFTAASTPSTTTLVASPTTAFASAPGNGVTLTATVTAGATGTVTFKDGNTNLTCAGGNPATISSNQATCATSFSAQGIRALSANYSGDGTFVASSGSANVFIENHAPDSGANTYCNNGAVTNTGASMSAYSSTSPYPSVIFVGDGVNTDIANPVSTVSVKLKGLTTNFSNGMQYLLVAPDGTHAYEFWSSGVGAGAAGTGDYILVDGSPQLPTNPISPGTYGPTAYSLTDVFTPAPPAPAPQPPGSFAIAPPVGNPPKTFLQAFTGAPAHGAWSLYLWDNGGPANPASLTGWCLTITPATGHPTTVTLTSNPFPRAVKGASVTFMATVASNPAVGNTGTVTFTENGTPLVGAPNSGVANVVNGVATIATSALPEGDHLITGQYHDNSNTFTDNFGSITIRVDGVTSTPTLNALLGANTWSYCNPNTITIPAGTVFANDFGPAQPNPSNVVVTNLFGTIAQVGVTLKSFTVMNQPNQLASLLVGPNGVSAPTSAQAFDFFSFTGSINNYSLASATFGDNGSALTCGDVVPPPGAFNAPQSCPGAATFTASPFFTLPADTQKAAPQGGFTFDTGNAPNPAIYKGGNPLGTWSLYFDQNTHGTGSSAGAGWCVDFIENPVVVTVTKGHIGNQAMNHFIQGEQNAKFTVDVHNQGPGPTGDPDGLHPLTVTDTLAAVFTPGTLPTGSPWDCTAAAQVVTCKEHQAIAQGGDYPQLIIPVNVSNTAGASAMNTAAVTGGGTSGTTNGTDNVIIDPAPVLSVTKTHNGTFSDGQTNAEWDITVNNTAVGSITSGTTNVSDTLPAGYTISSITASGWSCGGSVGTGTLSCTSTAVVSGGSSFPVIQMFVSIPINAGTPVSNTAKTWGGGDLNHVSSGTAASGSDNNVPVILLANLSITKNHVGTNFSQGQQGAQYTIVVSNGGGGATGASAVTVTDILPAGLTLAGTSSAGWSCSGTTTASCSYTPSIPAGGTATLTLNVNVGTTAGTPLSNTATVSCTCTQSSPNNNTSNTDMVNVTQLADLIVSKTHSPDPFTVSDQNDTFSVKVTNQGFAATTGTVTVTDTLPAGLTFNGTSTAGWACNANGSNPVICTTTNVLASGGGNTTLVLKVNVASSTNTPLTNNVSVACTCTESTTSNNSGTDMVPVTQVVNITLDVSPAGQGLTISLDGGAAVPGPHVFQLTPGTMHTITTTSPQPPAAVGTQYQFNHWSDMGAISHSITVPMAPATYTSFFDVFYQLNLTVSPSGGGTVSPASGTFYPGNASVNISATANSGYQFVNWTGATVGNANSASTTITMDAPHTVQANFSAQATNIGSTFTGKSGPMNARQWAFNVTNTGSGAANAAQITSFTMVQSGGPACSSPPVVGTVSVNGGAPQALPNVPLGNMGPSSSIPVVVTIDFSTCTSAARFTETMNLSANGGATTASVPRYNTFP